MKPAIPAPLYAYDDAVEALSRAGKPLTTRQVAQAMNRSLDVARLKLNAAYGDRAIGMIPGGKTRWIKLGGES